MLARRSPNRLTHADHSAWRWLLAFALAGAAWRVLRFGLCFPFWGDEAYLNISILHRSYADLCAPLEYAQIAPLLYLWIQRTIYLALGGGEYALRVFSLLAGLVALTLFARLAWNLLPPRAAALAVGVFAASYYLVRHTCESKPYAGDLCAATVLVAGGIAWLERGENWRPALLWTVAASVLVWLSYPAAFVAGGVIVAVLTSALRARRVRGALQAVTAGVIVVASFATFYLLCAAGQAERAAGSWLEAYWRTSFPPRDSAPALLWWLLETHTGRMLAYPVGGPDFGSSVTTVLCVIGTIGLVRRGRGVLVALLLSPLVLTFIAAWLRRYPYGGSVRVAIYMAPAVCLLAGAGLATLLKAVRSRRGSAILAAAVGAVLMVLPIGGAVRDILRPSKAPADLAIRSALADFTYRLARGERTAIFNPEEGTHGPPDGPAFHQSARYYLELYGGARPQWVRRDALGTEVRWILAYHGPEYGPTPEHVTTVLAEAGLRVVAVREYPLAGAGALRAYQCAHIGG